MLDALIQSQGPRLFGLCCRLCRSRGEAEDLYQETLLRDWNSRNGCWRRKIPGPTLPGSASIFIGIGPGDEGCYPLSAWKRRSPPDLCRRFSTAGPGGKPGAKPGTPSSGHLPEPYRQTVLLYYFCDQSIQQAAAALGVRPGTVKSRLGRGREMLKEVLKDG